MVTSTHTVRAARRGGCKAKSDDWSARWVAAPAEAVDLFRAYCGAWWWGFWLGGGGGGTVGENELAPVGLRFFSVGDTGGGAVVDVAVVVVVVVVLEGLLVPPPPQAAVNPPIATIAAAPAIAGRRRTKRPDVMM
jgi:hypothetical protein